MNKLINKYSDMKTINDIKDKSISFKISNFKHYCLKPMLILLFIYLIIIICFIGSNTASMLHDSPIVLLFILLLFIFLIVSLCNYIANYHVIYFNDNEVVVKNFFGKETMFNLANSLAINLSVGTNGGHGYNVQTVTLNLFERNTRKIKSICIDAIKEELIEKIFNNFIYE